MKNFNKKCYSILRRIPKGKVTTYKDIANALKSKTYRAVGRAMKKNHNKNIPCYKVIKSNGEIGGFNKGIKKKIRLLKKDGIVVKMGRVDLKRFGWESKL